MTYNGGAVGYGLVFSFKTNGLGYKDLLDFNVTNGEWPLGSLTLSGNMLYGMTQFGGTNNTGVLFSYNLEDAGINELKVASEKLKVYPNPNDGKFTIDVKSEELKVKNLEIYNVLGEKVYSGMPLNPLLPAPQGGNGQCASPNGSSGRAYPIDMSSSTSGVYFYRVLSEDGGLIESGKFVIE
jgi:uncharacterized repeat protein (TIGR03803 family)